MGRLKIESSVDLMQSKAIYDNLPMIETERLRLRKITMADVEEMFTYASNENVSRFVSWETHLTKADSKKFIQAILDKYDDKSVAPWGIEVKADKKFIGTIEFVSWQQAAALAELGYVVAEDYWGRGLVTEAAKALVQFGFDQMNLMRIEAYCIQENLASSRVMEKLGMTYEGTKRKAALSEGQHKDLEIYAILREEFYRN